MNFQRIGVLLSRVLAGVMLGVPFTSALVVRPPLGRLTRRVDGASLAAFRIALGVVGVVSVTRLVLHGWATSRYAGPAARFTYLGFGWVPRPSEGAMLLVLVTVASAAALVAVGWWYRPAIVTFLIGFTWVELIDVTTYLNHYWFVTLAGALLCFLPADACLSVAAWRRGAEREIPAGAVMLLEAQVAIVYVFAGIAKLHTDWLVHALPLRLWLPARTGLGPLDGWLDEAWVAHLLAVAGAAFDLAIVPMLLWRRTRVIAFGVAVAFHLVTWRLFPIGVFPWLMLAGATLFFSPAWPRRLPGVPAFRPSAAAPSRRRPALARAAQAAGVAWLVLQVAMPLRHHLLAGDARWTNEGYRFAWNVLAVERAGDVEFHLSDPSTGQRWVDDARRLYTDEQWRLMATEPDLVHQAALELARRARAQGHDEVEVRADVWVSLNGRRAAPLVDPDVDLAAQPRDPWHDTWILPAPSSPPPTGRR
jgi:hypothetical protein